MDLCKKMQTRQRKIERNREWRVWGDRERGSERSGENGVKG